MTPRIIIPHGLAADVLRVLHGRYGWQRDDDSLELWSADGSTWARIPIAVAILDLPVPVRDEPAEVSGEVG